MFSGFSEQPVAFPPSYKFDINSSQYDSSEKLRTPSWTVSTYIYLLKSCILIIVQDRVLFRSSSGGVIEGCGYGSDSTISSSDHRYVLITVNYYMQLLHYHSDQYMEYSMYNFNHLKSLMG